MISQEILKEANKLISGKRHADYGDKLTNHRNIATLWSIFLRTNISPHDVAMCMVLVKVARLMHAHKKDSYVDLAAYASIAGEIEARTDKHLSFETEGERQGRKTKEYISKLKL